MKALLHPVQADVRPHLLESDFLSEFSEPPFSRSASRIAGAIGKACLLSLLVAGSAAAQPGAETRIARAGEAQLHVVIGPEADEAVASAAADLAGYLQRISGAPFAVKTGDGRNGIVVGEPGDFDDLGVAGSFEAGPFTRDHYQLVSTGDGLFLLGATPLAVEFAVWDLLHRFGHRQFFPTETWEVIPDRPNLSIAINTREKPAYYNRSAPRGGMRLSLKRPWGYPEAWDRWRVRNRTKPSFTLHTGHAYLALIRRNRQVFDENPAFYAKVDGERKYRGGNTKICIGNARLRELVVEDAIRQVEADPDRDSISLDPSDGGGWCDETCEKCAPLGSVSDRVVILCNQVAEALAERFSRTYYVGIYAYNDYSPAPTLDVHPNVIVSLATAFIRGGQTFDEMLEGWSARTKHLGIREYYAVPAWNSAMPGAARAAAPDYLARTIPAHYEAGARFVNAESDESWGPNGFGYYLATRLLWDLETSADEVLDDFLSKAFGDAEPPMREFYKMLLGRPLHSDHMMGVMYRRLAEARQLADDPRIKARIDDLILYTRYVELHRRFIAAGSAEKQAAFDAVNRFVWRSRDRMMADPHGVFSYMNRRQRSTDAFSWGPEQGQRPEPPARLREGGDEPFGESEILDYLEKGIAGHEILDFEQLSFSDELVPAAEALELADREAQIPPQRRSRGGRTYYTWVADPPHTFRFRLTGGLIAHYRDRGDATLALRPVKEPFGNAVATASVPPDGQVREIVLETDYDGLHRIELRDGMDSSRLEWEPGTAMTFGLDFGSRYDYDEQVLYFYVPRGTEVIGGYADALDGRLIGPDGETVYAFENEMGYFKVPVPEGGDGKLWTFTGELYKNKFMLMTVPPYLARHPAELLLPREVVEADAR